MREGERTIYFDHAATKPLDGAEERLDHEAEVHTGDVDDPALLRLHEDDLQIGRASCRERV